MCTLIHTLGLWSTSGIQAKVSGNHRKHGIFFPMLLSVLEDESRHSPVAIPTLKWMIEGSLWASIYSAQFSWWFLSIEADADSIDFGSSGHAARTARIRRCGLMKRARQIEAKDET